MFNLEKVISDCKKGKRKAQVQLYNQYAARMLSVCLRYVADKSEAEDILQESFLKVLKNIKEYSGKGHFEGWMRKIVVNTAITHFHKAKKHYYHEEIDDVSEGELEFSLSPDKEYDAKELHRLLTKMPEGYRVIFNLYAVEGYKHREIAEQLKIDESTSKSQYLRAKKWLRKEMTNLNWL
jgi:RNA polymerase sigma-70 factor (ECF subfamily)